jgi:co-chaperonin GroES (HSP10)
MMMATTLEPMGNRVVGIFTKDTSEQKTGSIIIPKTVANSNIITVEIAKNGVDCVENLPIGSKVLIDKSKCIELKIDAINYILMLEEDILAIIE